MKVLFHAYNTCCQTESGGVQVRIRKIKALLEERGIIVDYFSTFETKLRNYDVLHIFSLKEESFGLVASAKKQGLKIVISPIVNTTKRRAHSITNSIRFARLFTRLSSESIEYQRYRIMQMCDYVFVESQTEAIFIEKYYRVAPSKIKVVPNGVEEPVPATDSIYEKLGKKCTYVLQVGRIEPLKNTLKTIQAVKGANYDLVVIGGKAAWGSDSYYNQCIDVAKSMSNVHMLGWLDPKSDLLSSAYQHAQAVVLPSETETFGLVALEGAMAGAHVCIANNLAILDFNVFNKELTFDSSDIKDIRRALDLAISTPKNNHLKDTVQRVFSWKSIIDEHINTYLL